MSVVLDDRTVLIELLFHCRRVKNCTSVAVTAFFTSATYNNRVMRLLIKKNVSPE